SDIFWFWFRFFLLFLRRKTQPALPSGIGVRVAIRFLAASASVAAETLHAGNRRTEAHAIGLLRHHAVFEARDRGQQLAGLEWLHDMSVSPDPARFFRFERFQLAHGQEHRNVRGFVRIL